MLLFCSFRDYDFTHFNGSGNMKDHLQATKGFEVFPFFTSQLELNLSRSISFIEKILTSSRFSFARHELWSVDDAYRHLVRWIGRFGYFCSKKIKQDLIKIYSLYNSPPGVVQTQRIHVFHNPIWCADLLNSSVIPFESSHLLSIFFVQH